MMWGARRPVPVGLKVNYRQEKPDRVQTTWIDLTEDACATFESGLPRASRNRQFGTPFRLWGSKYDRMRSWSPDHSLARQRTIR